MGDETNSPGDRDAGRATRGLGVWVTSGAASSGCGMELRCRRCCSFLARGAMISSSSSSAASSLAFLFDVSSGSSDCSGSGASPNIFRTRSLASLLVLVGDLCGLLASSSIRAASLPRGRRMTASSSEEAAAEDVEEGRLEVGLAAGETVLPAGEGDLEVAIALSVQGKDENKS